MPNPVVHFEIGCRDREATAAFYRSAFDWNIDTTPYMDVIESEEGGIAGHITSLGHEPHQYVTVYVQVDDIEAALAKIEGLGGKKILGPVPIPTGSFAWIQDPGGNLIGLTQRN